MASDRGDDEQSGAEDDGNEQRTIAELKASKAKAKAAFTRSRHKLYRLIEEEADTKEQQVAVDTILENVMEILNEMSVKYLNFNDIDSASRIFEEIEQITEAYNEVMDEVYKNRKKRRSTAKVKVPKEKVSDDDDVESYVTMKSQPSDSSIKDIDTHTSVGAGLSSSQQPTSNDNKLGEDMWRQMKRVGIPVFYGDKCKYQSWKASFLACIDKAPVSAEFKLLQLREYLGGDALKSIEKLGHSAASYEAAKERLDRKYGGDRRNIAHQYEEIEQFKPVRAGNARDVDKFADLLDITVINLKEANRTEELSYGSLYLRLLKKLPEKLITEYQRWVYENNNDETVETLREWVVKEAEFSMIANETVHGLAKSENTFGMKQNINTKSAGQHATHFSQQRDRFTVRFKQQLVCAYCQGSHGIWLCDEFKKLTSAERWQLAKEKKLCFRCLGSTHIGQSCRRTATCGINGCTKSHHRLLHREARSDVDRLDSELSHVSVDPPMNRETAVKQKEGVRSDNVTMVTKGSGNQVVALRTVPVLLKNGNRSVRVNALLDDCSTKTYLNADVAAELMLAGKPRKVVVNVMNGRTEAFETMPVVVQLQSLDRSVDIEVNAFTTDKVTGDLVAIDWKKHQSRWPHLQGITFPFIETRGTIDMLIGADYADLHIACHEVRGEPGQPIARLTPLGWTCVGNISSGEDAHRTNFIHTFYSCEAPIGGDVDSMLQKFWEVESVSKTNCCDMSLDDQQVLKQAVDSVRYSDGRYEVAVPWKEVKCALPNNYDMALNRLIGTEKRLNKEPVVREAYSQCLQQYNKKGYIKKVQGDISEPCWFLPHFPVIRPDKETTKTRIVFDASATYKGRSLNQCINTGPKLQQELTAVLNRFRRNPVAIVCDIAEMYLRITIRSEDRQFFRFLWREMNSSRLPDIYEFSRVVFGASCSPFLAQLVIREHAKRHQTELPRAAETVLKSTYMDDSMDSVPTEKHGIELYQQLSELLARADMCPRKWLSNSSAVRRIIPVEDQAKEIEFEGNFMQGTKTLGVIWLSNEDAFTFSFRPIPEAFTYTKRNVLKKVATLFDPLGFLAPFIVRAKMLLQKIWLAGLSWDEPLDENLQQEAKQWFTELGDVSELKVARCLCSADRRDMQSMELHVFVDASCDAYGAVIYARCMFQNGDISCSLVCAKTKVAPLSATSIPRLELMAAILGLRLAITTAQSLEIDISTVTFWSDSMNVLWWLRRRSRVFQPFVANRIGEIHDSVRPCQWKYVPTDQNPADLASRGTKAAMLARESVWVNGPEYLIKTEDHWPNEPITHNKEALNEIKRKCLDDDKSLTATFLINLQFEGVDRLDPARFSNWKHLTRICAWVVRYINNSRVTKSERVLGELNCEEIDDVEKQLIKQCQQQSFQEEFQALKTGKVLSDKSKLLMLNPRLDEDGLMRSDSRLIQGDMLSFDLRYPIILPRRHSVTQLVVKEHHERGAHVGGTNHTLSCLSQKYWIVSGREAVRECEASCATCRKRKARAATQIMAPLPSSRINMPTELRCFVHVGLDFAGPFLTMRGRGKTREKRYLCLFTCMHTRAVHLEMAYGLDTDSFIRAFGRFSDRRGCPEEITSDNGRNFIGANREMKEVYEQLDHNKIKKIMSVRNIKWHFNPPLAPHFGGVFEIMIRAAKRATNAILSNADITDEELQSAFIGAEALLNSRPLTYQSANCQDATPLTPGHFLHGQLGGHCVTNAIDISHPKQRWRRVQELIRHFWHRWMKEWLPSLSTRKKWRAVNRDFAVGDVVLIVAPDTPRGHWPLGRITAVHPGQDGHVRVVKVQVGQTVYTRAVSSICPLEYDSENIT